MSDPLLPVPDSEIDPSAVSAHEDPPGTPWAMPIVVRTSPGPAGPPATHEGTLEAAGAAVALFLADVDADAAHPAGAAVARWRAGRIRKVVRRAKPGAEWDRALAAGSAHVRVVTVDGSAVAVFCPTPVDEVPADIKRLQVTGLDLPRRSEAGPTPAGAVQLAMSPYLAMTTGKAVAQAGHAAQLAYQQLGPESAQAWLTAGAPVSVSFPDPAEWSAGADRATVTVRDAGFTEVPPGVRTVIASGPTPARSIALAPGRDTGGLAPR